MGSLPFSTASPLAALFLAVSFSGSTADAQEWGRFRGPNGSGVSPSTGLPTEFGPDKNLAWRTELPNATSSPVIADESVFLTASTDENLLVVCLDRTTGGERWTRELERARTTPIYKANDSASPSPVTDGENVYAFFAELGLVSLDAKGEERWRLPLGPFVSFYGMSSSPILTGNTLILLCDQQQGSFLIAVNATTGEELWKTERTGLIECWTTPILYPADAPTTILIFGSFFVTGYSLETGEEVLRMKGMGYTPAPSPVLDGDRLFACVQNHAGQPFPKFESILADYDADQDGALVPAELEGSWVQEHFGWADANRDEKIVASEWEFILKGMSSRDYGLVAIDLEQGPEGLTPTESWRYKRSLPEISSPLLYDGVIYLVKSGGIVTSVAATTGEVLKSGRIRNGGSEYYPSPIAADGKIYIASNAGEITVLSAEGDWSILSEHELGEEIQATPAIAGNALFVRTQAALYCFRDASSSGH